VGIPLQIVIPFLESSMCPKLNLLQTAFAKICDVFSCFDLGTHAHSYSVCSVSDQDVPAVLRALGVFTPSAIVDDIFQVGYPNNGQISS
jgi:hypothetical protein